ncbi:hypothetical protein BBJ28_00011889 [Nothophytophthora sp. Chile5]|nr:hypothetical protein BBJ28_00011889 [Nothophytophthora sp. Chile5]
MWVKDIYEPAFDGKYLQAAMPLPKKTLDLLENIFEMKQASYGAVITGNDSSERLAQRSESRSLFEVCPCESYLRYLAQAYFR